jgi:hypothetical protein
MHMAWWLDHVGVSEKNNELNSFRGSFVKHKIAIQMSIGL